jgi:hypothetical protein
MIKGEKRSIFKGRCVAKTNVYDFEKGEKYNFEYDNRTYNNPFYVVNKIVMSEGNFNKRFDIIKDDMLVNF